MAYVAAFSAAGLGGIERRTRKPFDSVIGESFELETAGFALVAEQIESDVGVSQVDGKTADWSLFTNSSVNTCFHGLHITVDVTAYVRGTSCCCARHSSLRVFCVKLSVRCRSF